MVDDPPIGLPSHRVWALAGIPPSTLNYWVQTGVVRPSLRGPEGKRVEQWWTTRDVVVVRVVRALRTAGAPMAQIRRARRQLESWGEDLASCQLYWDGRSVLVADGHDAPVSVGLQPGQRVWHFMVLPVGEWEAEAATDDEAVPVDLLQFRQRRRARRKEQRGRVIVPADILKSLESGGA